MCRSSFFNYKSHFQPSSQLIFTITLELGIIFILQMMKLRFKEGKHLSGRARTQTRSSTYSKSSTIATMLFLILYITKTRILQVNKGGASIYYF